MTLSPLHLVVNWPLRQGLEICASHQCHCGAQPTSTLSGSPYPMETPRLSHVFFRSPVLRTVDLMFCACFFFFFSQLTFSDVCKPKFSKLFHMTWLYSKKKRCYVDFIKVPPNKNEGENPQISPNLASDCNILCAVARNVEGK